MDEMNGVELAERVLKQFQTQNVFEIAEKSGINVICETWFPATFGEFHWKKKEIFVNKNAGIPVETIIAHELGHYFLKEYEIKIASDEEKFCDEFADKLLR